VATILLRNRKGIVVDSCLVDDVDFESLSQHRWTRHNRGYVHRSVKGTTGLRLLMHRQIMGDPPVPGLEIDHVNRCKKDNRRCNLRWVTRSENRENTPPRADNASGYKHINKRVSRRTGRVSYRVWHVNAAGKTVFSPALPTLHDAIVARNAMGYKD